MRIIENWKESTHIYLKELGRMDSWIEKKEEENGDYCMCECEKWGEEGGLFI